MFAAEYFKPHENLAMPRQTRNAYNLTISIRRHRKDYLHWCVGISIGFKYLMRKEKPKSKIWRKNKSYHKKTHIKLSYYDTLTSSKCHCDTNGGFLVLFVSNGIYNTYLVPTSGEMNSSIASRRGKEKGPSRFALFFPIFSPLSPIYSLFSLFSRFLAILAGKGGTLPPWSPSGHATWIKPTLLDVLFQISSVGEIKFYLIYIICMGF